MSESSVLGSYLLFDLRDGRRVSGNLQSLDGKGDAVLADVIVELPKNFISPVNAQLIYNFDNNKDFDSRLRYFCNETEGKSLSELEKCCYCVNGLILPQKAIVRVSRIIKS